MENWDQNKLESVIDKKYGKDNSQKPTEIVCKYFLEAIETKKYGFVSIFICNNYTSSLIINFFFFIEFYYSSGNVQMVEVNVNIDIVYHQVTY